MYSKNFDGIPITFLKSKRAKRIIIRIKPFGGVKVSVPLFASYGSAENFVLSRINWIKKSNQKCLSQQNEQRVFEVGESYSTKHHLINFISHSEKELKVVKCEKTISILLPDNDTAKGSIIQDQIKKEVIKIWRIEAKEYLPNRLAQLALVNGINYGKVTIRNTKTRWGSCSHLNNINLSLHLMRLPEKLIDYVILHELAHVKVKNHSPAFWSYLNEICENAKLLDQQLKKYNPVIL